MNEASPNVPKIQQQAQEDYPSRPERESRVVALDGTRRELKPRHSKAASRKRNVSADDADEESVNSEDEEQSDREGPVMHPAKSTTNNHYTLNLASSTPTKNPDLPYALSGRVSWLNALAMSLMLSVDISKWFSTLHYAWYFCGCCCNSSSLFRGMCSREYWNTQWVR